MRIEYLEKKKVINVFLSGDYINYDDFTLKDKLLKLTAKKELRQIVFYDNGLGQWDSSLLLILYNVQKALKDKDVKIDVSDLPVGLQKMLELAFSVDRKPPHTKRKKFHFLERVGEKTILCRRSVLKGVSFLSSVCSSFIRFFSGKAVFRRVDFWFSLDDCGPKAVGIVSLISFMVGLILAFVGALQLKTFGAEVYIASLVTIGMIRIMGAIMTGVIMAGRTGASYAATIGSMQVNEEVDALKTMGISVSDFLVLPKVMALTLSMPLLTILSDFMGMIGGGFVGVVLLGIPMPEYFKFSVDAFGLANFLVGIFHAFIFGLIISLCGCYFGIHCKKDADSVGKSTTLAVVSSIVWMIVATGIMTLIFQVMGI